MRALFIGALALCACPIAAHAQELPEPAEEFAEVERALGAPRPEGTWRLDDGLGTDEVEWDSFDASRDYYPRGGLHWGLEMRVNALPVDSLTTSPRPQLELSAYANLRYSESSPWQIRIGLAVGWELHESTNLGGGTFVTSSAMYVRLRVLPLSFDMGRNFGLRFGPDIGFQYAPSPGGGKVIFGAGGLAQLVGRTDDGRFEMGVVAGFQMTGVDRLERPNAFDPNHTGGESYVFDPVLGLSAGYLF